MLCAAEEQAEAAKAKAAKGHSSPAKRNAKARNDEGNNNKISDAFAYIHSTQLGLGHSTQLGGPDCGTGGCPPGHTIMSSDVFSYIHSSRFGDPCLLPPFLFRRSLSFVFFAKFLSCLMLFRLASSRLGFSRDFRAHRRTGILSQSPSGKSRPPVPHPSTNVGGQLRHWGPALRPQESFQS